MLHFIKRIRCAALLISQNKVDQVCCIAYKGQTMLAVVPLSTMTPKGGNSYLSTIQLN